MTGVVHRYGASARWSGSTAVGYEHYDRGHRSAARPAAQELDVSSDPAFGGDAARLNPEQLVVMAASSCQLLAFLAVAARARLDVREYADDATAEMPEDDPPVRLREIVLHPRITLAVGPTEERVRRLVDLAHRECFIANSLATPVRVEPEVVFVDA